MDSSSSTKETSTATSTSTSTDRTANTQSSSESRYDVVLWGATGFTGKLACEYMAKTYGLPSDACRYAIAARTQSRLDEVERAMIDTAKLHNKTNNQTSVPKILASVDDQSSIDKMVLQAKVVLAMAGPFKLCGEPVVKSCVENKAHYIDCTGEMEFVAKMRNKYNQLAKKNRVKIVPCCGGLDFMPNEFALHFIQEQCATRSLTIKAVNFDADIAGSGFSGGTLRSIMEMLKDLPLSQMSQLNDPYSVCSYRPSEAIVQANRTKGMSVRYNSDAKKYATFSAITSTISKWTRWSNEAQDFVWGKDLVMQTSQLTPTMWRAAVQLIMSYFMLFAAVVMSRIPFLAKFPDSGFAQFDGGVIQKEKYYNAYITAEVEDSEGVTKLMNCTFNGPYELYWMTGISIVEAAISACKDTQTPNYGVMGCSGALGKPYFNRLQEKNIAMKFVSISKKN